MSVKKAIERLDELKRVYGNDYVDYSELREILTALDEPEDLASKTINGSSLGWMLDQIRKQDKRLMAVEKAYELERLEDIERRIGELDSKVARIIYETNCYEAIYGKPSVPEKPVTDEKPKQTLEDAFFDFAWNWIHCNHLEHATVKNLAAKKAGEFRSHQDPSKVSIDRKVVENFILKTDENTHALWHWKLIDAITQALKEQV